MLSLNDGLTIPGKTRVKGVKFLTENLSLHQQYVNSASLPETTYFLAQTHQYIQLVLENGDLDLDLIEQAFCRLLYF